MAPHFESSVNEVISMERRVFLTKSLAGLASTYLGSRTLLASSPPPSIKSLLDRPLRTLAFGSCNRQEHDQGYWRSIAATNPQLWLWLGDNIYADGASMEQRKASYAQQKRNPYYQDFISRVPLIGVWDDHDYAANNADGRFTDKVASQAALLDFLGTPYDHPVYQQEGVYQSYELGPKGQRTQMILLDL
ncbi:MAG: alkaline phosphatase D family protein, partial [Proteobacteria bacterium]|nr:alkaline phosphatase D family protein [Pseudomonadota bacterium]